MTTGKTIALTRQTFVGKVMSLLFNMLSRLVITFLPGSKRLLISLLQSPSAVILEPRKIKSATVSTVSPCICHEVMGPDAIILVFWMLSFKPYFKPYSNNPVPSLILSPSAPLLSEPCDYLGPPSRSIQGHWWIWQDLALHFTIDTTFNGVLNQLCVRILTFEIRIIRMYFIWFWKDMQSHTDSIYHQSFLQREFGIYILATKIK